MHSFLRVLLLTLLSASFNPPVLGNPISKQGASNTANLAKRAAPLCSTSDAGLTLLRPLIQENNKRVFSSAIEDWWVEDKALLRLVGRNATAK